MALQWHDEVLILFFTQPVGDYLGGESKIVRKFRLKIKVEKSLTSNSGNFADFEIFILQASSIASSVFQRNKASAPSGVVTWPTSSDISRPRPLTSPSRMSTNKSSWAVLTRRHSSGATSSETWDPVVLLEPLLFASSILWITLVPAWVLMSAKELLTASTTAWLTASRRPSSPTASLDCTVASACPFRVSSSTALPTSVATTQLAAHCPTPRTLHSS